MNLFSIIVPIYNVEAYLPKCLDSLLHQTYSDYELILVDDGSTDGCAMICDSYAKVDSRIKVIHKKNEGLVEARKSGIKVASGEFILNVDSDDYINEALLAKIYSIISSYNPDIISFDYQEVDEAYQPLRPVTYGLKEGYYCKEDLSNIKKHYMYDRNQKHFNTGCLPYTLTTKAIRRNLISKFQLLVPSEISNGEDLAVVTPCLCGATSIYVMNYVGYYYLQRKSSIVHSFKVDDIDRVLNLLDFLEKHSEKIPKENVNSYAFRMLCGQFSKAVQSLSYDDFLTYVSENMKNKRVISVIDSFDSSTLGIKGRIIASCIKKRIWRLFWIIYSKK